MLYKKENYKLDETSFKRGNKRRLLLLLIGIFLLIGMTGCGESGEYIKTIKEGAFNSYPNTKIGPAFDDFFEDPEWEYFESKSGKNIVEFTGKFIFISIKAEAKMQFEIYDDGSFTMEFYSIEGVPQNEDMKSEMIDRVIGYAR